MAKLNRARQTMSASRGFVFGAYASLSQQFAACSRSQIHPDLDRKLGYSGARDRVSQDARTFLCERSWQELSKQPAIETSCE